MYIANPNHPSLRVKKMKGTSGFWELSLTMNYRLTFEVEGEVLTLRRVGTHDTLRHP
jgi:mRNA-degrading endonuclease YafQ of YafQ-DinJ toxin-antitoxin module